MREECDYTQEAENQRLFGRLLRGPDRSVPEVLDERCARRVLTAALDEGIGFSRFCDEASQELRDRAGATIFDAAFSCIFAHCVYNADPHPGNYLFDDGGAGDLPRLRLRQVLESHYPGWRATVDGEARRLYRANGAFLGLRVPAGEHRVSLTFAPRRQAVGFWVSGAGLLLVLLVVGGILIARRRRRALSRSA